MNARHDTVTVFVARPTEDNRSHEFLQLRRAAGDYMGGTWQIIRGGVDPHETWLAAGLRELREESGLTPDGLYRLGLIESFYIAVDDTLWHSVPFCAIVSRAQEVRLNEEHDAYRWIPRDAIIAHTMWASERQVLEEVCREILDDGQSQS